MAVPQIITSSDGARIAYRVTGSGPALMLLHGFGASGDDWLASGVVARLADDFTLIMPDLRGDGGSDTFTDPARYSPAAHCADLDAVAGACGAETVMLWGVSWGATITRHMTAHWDRVTRAVMGSTYFGPIFTEALVGEYAAYYKNTAAGSELDMWLARVYGLRAWPGVEPSELRCPALVYTGTRDTATNVFPTLQTQRAALRAAGVAVHVFDGLDHSGLADPDIVLPVVKQFLHG